MPARNLSRLHRAARLYADQLGLAVFPLVPGTKFPFRGSKGELDGTTDLEQIDKWWSASPEAGIACALRFTPYWVLDIDARSNGHLWLQQMADSELTTVTCATRSDGSAHYWFQRTEQLQGYHMKGISWPGGGEPVAGVDVKGLSLGYVVLPPTVHPVTKKPYAWLDQQDPLTCEIQAPPLWLVQHLFNGRPPRQRTETINRLDVGLDDFPRARELREQGYRIGKQLGPGKWVCECPNASAHSTGKKQREDSSTVLFAPSHSGGHGRIYCSHAHCAHVR